MKNEAIYTETIKPASLTKDQMMTMLKLQDEMNSVVNPGWRDAGYAWGRAIMVESVEAMESAGWKWWKHQSPDMQNVRTELVDIWHFALSMYMESEWLANGQDSTHEHSMIAEGVTNAINTAAPDDALIFALQDYLQAICKHGAENNFYIAPFGMAMKACDMTWQDLYVTYIGKNCLNLFRQANGYKTGEYIKDWSAVPIPSIENRLLEDNDHMHEIMSRLDAKSERFRDDVMAALSDTYLQVKDAPAPQRPRP